MSHRKKSGNVLSFFCFRNLSPCMYKFLSYSHSSAQKNLLHEFVVFILFFMPDFASDFDLWTNTKWLIFRLTNKIPSDQQQSIPVWSSVCKRILLLAFIKYLLMRIHWGYQVVLFSRLPDKNFVISSFIYFQRYVGKVVTRLNIILIILIFNYSFFSQFVKFFELFPIISLVSYTLHVFFLCRYVGCFIHTHTHTHTYMYIYIYIYMEREREKGRE